MRILWHHPARPWVAPFALFYFFLVVGGMLGLGRWEFPLRVAVLSAAIWCCSRGVISLRCPNWTGSTAVGIVVFFIWVGPDILVPNYRDHWLFQNAFF